MQEIQISKEEFFDLHIDGDDANFLHLSIPQKALLSDKGFDKDNLFPLYTKPRLDLLIPCPPRCTENNPLCSDISESVSLMTDLFGDEEKSSFDYDAYIFDNVGTLPLRLDLGYLNKKGQIRYGGQMCKSLLEKLINFNKGALSPQIRDYFKWTNSDSGKPALFVGYQGEPVQDRYIGNNYTHNSIPEYDAYIKAIVSQVSSDAEIYPKFGGVSVRLKGDATFFSGTSKISITQGKVIIDAGCVPGGKHNITLNIDQSDYEKEMDPAKAGVRFVGDRGGKCEGATFSEARIKDGVNYRRTGLLVAN